MSVPCYNVVMAPHLTQEERSFIIQRYRESASLREIGREIGRPDITVRRVLEAAGLYAPQRPEGNKASPSSETEALIVRLYDEGVTWSEIARQSGFTAGTISKVLTRTGRQFDRQPEQVGDAALVLSLYESGHSTRAIARMLGYGKTTINNAITRNGGVLRKAEGCGRPDFFSNVNSEEKAYWLGFISADGCMVTTAKHPEGNHLSFRLGIKDREHLDKLRETVQAAGTVRTGVGRSFGKVHGHALLDIHSREIAEDLLRLDIMPRKSEDVRPWDGPEHLMPHFWRGLFDGDGSFAVKGPNRWSAFMCGSEPCVRGFQEWAHELCGTTAEPYFRSGCWYVSIGGWNMVRKIAETLYGDATVSLRRKQEIANRILGTE